MAQNKERRGQRAPTQSSAPEKNLSTRRPLQPCSPLAGRRLRIEPLEDRRLLAVFVVNTIEDLEDDTGPAVIGSLRHAINLSNLLPNSDKIVFDDFLFENGPRTIELDMAELAITNPLQILGPSANLLTVEASAFINEEGVGTRIFNVADDDDEGEINVLLAGMTITRGQGGMGGAIFNKENLTVVESIITGNTASGVGGGIFVERGALTINRSVISYNNAGQGGGVYSGLDGEDTQPYTTITNSTITGNSSNALPYSYGGGVFNRNGTTYIAHSTFAYNTASVAGLQVASWGNLPADEESEEPPPLPTVFTRISHSIAWDGEGTYSNVSTVGKTDDFPPKDLLLSAWSLGANLIGGMPSPSLQLAPPPPAFSPDIYHVAADPLFVSPFLQDVGGAVPTLVPNADPLFGPVSPAIDFGNPDIPEAKPLPFEFDTRGRHFTRLADGDADGVAITDSGAYEAQAGNWVVDSLEDESDTQFSAVWDEDLGGYAEIYSNPYEATIDDVLSEQQINPYGVASSRGGDFTLREAIEFANKLPAIPDVSGLGLQSQHLIRFSTQLVELVDPNPFTPGPTINITEELQLSVAAPTMIQGPTTFELEVDASSSDPTPSINDSLGIRVFRVDDGTATTIDVSMSNLTIMGGDVGFEGAVGGGILNLENLTVTESTIKENASGAEGAGILHDVGTLRIDRSTLANNVAALDGGGLAIGSYSGAATVSNSTISGNTASVRGGGVLNFGSAARIEYSTITDNNTSAILGSGVFNYGASAALEITHTIISGNINFDIDQLGGASLTSLGHNLVGDGNAALLFTATGDLSGAAFKNPQLKPLVGGGGPTPTHEPLPTSPAINAGADPSGADVPTNDQRGALYNRIDSSAGVIDIGAYELQGITYFVDTTADVDNGNFELGDLSLREAVLLSNTTPLRDVIDLSLLTPGASLQMLAQGEVGVPTDLVLTDTVGINGSGVTINGAFDSRLFTIDDSDDLTKLDIIITDLTVTNTFNRGKRGFGVPLSTHDGMGGVLYNSEDLTLRNWMFVNNGTEDPELVPGDVDYTPGAQFHGGTIAHRLGNLVIENSTFLTSTASGAGANGGAIYARDGNVSVTDSRLSGGGTTDSNSDGGGIYIRNGELTMDNTIVSGNTTPGGSSSGAGVYSFAGDGDQTTVVITDSILSGNSSAGSFSPGAGLANWGSDVTISYSNVSGNSTTGTGSRGAGVYQWGGSLTINDSLIAQNTTSGTDAHGGGIANVNSDVAIHRSRIFTNSAAADGTHGGGIHSDSGNVQIYDSTLADNLVTGDGASGGGVYSDTNLLGLTTSIINSTLSGNTAILAGGGIYNASGLTNIRHSTIANNEVAAYGFGAGVGSHGNSANTRTLVHSSIISDNQSLTPLAADFVETGMVDGADFLALLRGFGSINASKAEGDATGDEIVDGADVNVFFGSFGQTPKQTDVDRVGGPFHETFVSDDFNLVGTGLSIGAFNGPNDIVGVDAEMGPLANNGGPTRTRALLEGSPAINAGDPGFNPNSFTPALDYDQRGTGFDRVIDFTIDIGAFESPAIVAAAVMAPAAGNSAPIAAMQSLIAEPVAEPVAESPAGPVSSQKLADTGDSALAGVAAARQPIISGPVRTVDQDLVSPKADATLAIAKDILLAVADFRSANFDFGELAVGRSHRANVEPEDERMAFDRLLFDLLDDDASY
ncbi:MAG: hypothetical protein MK171_09135 [Pirellulales bacterium]|nr:hypothetical protein [Pirellulales bacterium]